MPTSLKVNGGLGNKVLDLRDANLTRIKLDGGLGSTDITLPQQGQFTASIDGGIGDNTIRIPAGLAVSIRFDSGLGSRQVQGNFIQTGNAYASPDYESATHRADMKIDQGIGGLTIVEIE